MQASLRAVGFEDRTRTGGVLRRIFALTHATNWSWLQTVWPGRWSLKENARRLVAVGWLLSACQAVTTMERAPLLLKWGLTSRRVMHVLKPLHRPPRCTFCSCPHPSRCLQIRLGGGLRFDRVIPLISACLREDHGKIWLHPLPWAIRSEWSSHSRNRAPARTLLISDSQARLGMSKMSALHLLVLKTVLRKLQCFPAERQAAEQH